MKKEYEDSQSFVDDLHIESLKGLTLELGYLTEDDFKGSKVSCIFHENDNTPSLQVTDNFFRCYACGARGDIIKWVQFAENLNFIEALNFIAEKLHITLHSRSFAKYNTVKFNLEKEWKQYLQNMNDLIARNDGLSKHVTGMVKDLFPFQVGYDTSTNYIVLPFTSKTGSVLGFTKRRVDYPQEREGTKWIHSSIKKSLIEHCSNIFNLHDAHIEISKKRHVYSVEGPKDVAAVRRIGIKNVIAVCGTSNFNDKILGILGPIRSIDFCYDGDEAGRIAMARNIAIIAELNPALALNSRVIPLPEGEDPASIDPKVLKERFLSPVNGIEWIVKNRPEEDIVSLVEKSSSSIIKDRVIYLLNSKLGYYSSQSREWLDSRIRRNKDGRKDSGSNDMKRRLLATIGELDDIDVEPLKIPEEEARKILKLRFDYE